MLAKPIRRKKSESSQSLPVAYPRIVQGAASSRFRLHRTSVWVTPAYTSSQEQRPILSSLLLSDISRTGVLIFSTQPLGVGLRVDVSAESPSPFYAYGRVLFCRELLNNTRVISEFSWSYRVGIVFENQTADEKAFLSRYLEEIAKLSSSSSSSGHGRFFD
jgi:hypothetical protein